MEDFILASRTCPLGPAILFFWTPQLLPKRKTLYSLSSCTMVILRLLQQQHPLRTMLVQKNFYSSSKERSNQQINIYIPIFVRNHENSQNVVSSSSRTRINAHNYINFVNISYCYNYYINKIKINKFEYTSATFPNPIFGIFSKL